LGTTTSIADLRTPRVRSVCASVLLSVMCAVSPRRFHALAAH
jgi:hypothetical protein